MASLIHRFIALAMANIFSICMCAAVRAQSSTGSKPLFEVASIKPAPDCDASRPANITPDSVTLSCTNLRSLIRIAYTPISGRSFPSSRIGVIGGPSWIDKDTYRVEAKAESKASLGQMLGPMLQTLIEDRFQVRVHRETRDQPVYELTATKSNSNLRPTKEGSCFERDSNDLSFPATIKPILHFKRFEFYAGLNHAIQRISNSVFAMTS